MCVSQHSATLRRCYSPEDVDVEGCAVEWDSLGEVSLKAFSGFDVTVLAVVTEGVPGAGVSAVPFAMALVFVTAAVLGPVTARSEGPVSFRELDAQTHIRHSTQQQEKTDGNSM